MSRFSLTDPVKTPEGVQVPAIVYAAWTSILIAAGSAIGMQRLAFPWWIWVIEALLLLPFAYMMIRYSAVKNEDGEWVMGRRKNLLTFSAISATILIFALIASCVI